MKIQVKNKNEIIIGKPYAGVIDNYIYDEKVDKLAIFVRLYDAPDEVYSYDIKVDVTPKSDFLKFCYQIGIRDMKNNKIDFDEFLNMEVICEIAEDENGNKHVDFIDNLWWNCYTNEEEFQDVFHLSDEEMDIFYHQGVEKIVWSEDKK